MSTNSYLAIKASIPAHVQLVAVSKTKTAAQIREIYALGQRDFGENKVQELVAKSQELADLSDIRWHFIGHLQTNKVRELLEVQNLALIHSVDRVKLIDLFDKELVRLNRRLPILLQVNCSGETSKYGCTPEEAMPIAQHIARSTSLELRGLMTIGLLGGNEAQTQNCFRILAQLRGQLLIAMPANALPILSMGMSGDYTAAIEEGSNMVRIGQAIFGPRALPDSHYWREKAGAL